MEGNQGMGLKLTPVIAKHLLGHLSMFGPMSGTSWIHSQLNQARASLWPAHAWFLKIDPVRIVGMHTRTRVCVCVCPCPRLLITSGVI